MIAHAPLSASAAVRGAADFLMVRWREKQIGGSEADDAAVLRALNALDGIAAELEEIEVRRGRETRPGKHNRWRFRVSDLDRRSRTPPYNSVAKPIEQVFADRFGIPAQVSVCEGQAFASGWLTRCIFARLFARRG